MDDSKHFVRTIDADDSLSLVSLGSQVSLNSHVSSSLGTFDIINRTEESLPEMEFIDDTDISNIKIDPDIFHDTNDSPLVPHIMGSPMPPLATPSPISPEPNKVGTSSDNDFWIGHINEQPLLHYIVRLIATKFLLAGAPHQLITDKAVRVSIKSLSLQILSHCVDFCPNVLLLGLRVSKERPSQMDDFDSLSSDEEDTSSSFDADTVAEQPRPDGQQAQGDQLVIKDDHFGESSSAASAYFDFMSPLSKSADHVLLSQLHNADQIFIEQQNKRLNNELTDLLSKSDTVETSYSRSQPLIEQSVNRSSTPRKAAALSKQDDANAMLVCEEINDQQQYVADVIRYADHGDPMLRANTLAIVGNFVGAVLLQSGCFAKFFSEYSKNGLHHVDSLDKNELLRILLEVSGTICSCCNRMFIGLFVSTENHRKPRCNSIGSMIYLTAHLPSHTHTHNTHPANKQRIAN